MRRYQQQAAGFGVSLTAYNDGPAPAVADADRVLQVVSNLVENALRLTPRGGEVRVITAPGLLRVEDTGPGLQPEEHAHAFERFYLHERYGRERAVGTGPRARDREGADRGDGRHGRSRERARPPDDVHGAASQRRCQARRPGTVTLV